VCVLRDSQGRFAAWEPRRANNVNTINDAKRSQVQLVCSSLFEIRYFFTISARKPGDTCLQIFRNIPTFINRRLVILSANLLLFFFFFYICSNRSNITVYQTTVHLKQYIYTKMYIVS